MARFSFGKVSPSDLEVQLQDVEGKALTGLPDQFKGLYEGVPQVGEHEGSHMSDTRHGVQQDKAGSTSISSMSYTGSLTMDEGGT